MKTASYEQITHRTRNLILCVSVTSLIIIIVSILQFGSTVQKERNTIGLILPTGRESSNWSRSQYHGLHEACTKSGYDLMVQEHVHTGTGESRKAVEELVQKGVRMIFLPSHGYLKEVQDLVHHYPKITFYSRSVELTLPHVISYSVRSYEPRFLSGILAGLRTKTNRIGYIAPMESLEINRGINAFALGVQQVNPDAIVMVCWTGAWDDPDEERNAAYHLRQKNADFLTYHLDGPTAANTAEYLGIDYIGCYETDPEHKHCLGTVTVNWTQLHINLLHQDIQEEKNGAGFYWPGLSDEIVNLSLSESKTTEAERQQIALARQKLQNGHTIFSGEINDLNDYRRSLAGESLSLSYLQTKMNWLVKGVEIIDSR